MTAIATGRIERMRPVRTRVNTAQTDIRTATDKYWSLLFVIFFIIFIAAGRNVVHKSDCQPNCDNSTQSKNSSQFFNNIPDSYSTFINNTVKYISHVWGQNWLFSAITCNVAFLDVHYENSGVIVVVGHLLVCGILIAYSCASMRTDELFCRQLHLFAILYLICTFISRIANFSKKDYEMDFLIIFCALPEIILLIVVCSKLSIIERRTMTSIFERNISITDFTVFVVLCVYLSSLLIFLSTLLIAEALKNYELSLNNELSSYIFVGAMVYICLTFYYYLLMQLSCSTSLSLGRKTYLHSPDPRDYFYGLFKVARYHFGTVCYQATLILPWINATFVMNEKEFNGIPNFSKIRRFHLTHWKVQNLSMMITGACGYDHDASTREMLRLFTRDSPKLVNFHSYKQMFRSLSALLIAINSLMFISLWIHGIPLDRSSVNNAWVASLIGMFVTNLIAEIFDTVADVLWFYYDGTIPITI